MPSGNHMNSGGIMGRNERNCGIRIIGGKISIIGSTLLA